MNTNQKELRATLFPYCLQRLPDGSYIALNRDYKPLGFMDCGWVRYEDFPARFRFARRPSAATLRALSWNSSENPEAVFFYNDGSVPFLGSQPATDAYLDRLARLGRLKVYAEATPAAPLDPLRELLRETIEGLVSDSGWWESKFPEAEAELRMVLRLLDDSAGLQGAPLMVNLHAAGLSNTELAPRIERIESLMRIAWPKRWRIHEHLDAAKKAATLAFCD